jgi:hypothetical protein
MLSLLYLSYNEIADELANQEVQAISHKSIISNKRKDITGALIFTGTHFCQFLEGPDDAVSSLAGKIRRDPRHTDIWVVHQEAITVRRFASWSMGYKGRSNFVGRYLLDIVNASEKADREKAAKSVIAMMEEFVRK